MTLDERGEKKLRGTGDAGKTKNRRIRMFKSQKKRKLNYNKFTVSLLNCSYLVYHFIYVCVAECI